MTEYNRADMPLVTIISPCYNGESYAGRFFENILEQTYDNIHLIFVDDGSTDSTEAIARGYQPQFKERKQGMTFLTKENGGSASAVNLALGEPLGDLVIWTDSDDILTKDHVAKKVAYMNRHPEIHLMQCFGSEVLESDLTTKVRDFRRIPPRGAQADDPFFLDLIEKRNVEYTPGIYMVRAQALKMVLPQEGIYPSRIGQNMQILLPLAYNYRCGYLKEDLFRYVIRETSHSHSITAHEAYMKRIDGIGDILRETVKNIDLKNPIQNKKVMTREAVETIIELSLTRFKFDAAYHGRDLKRSKENYNKLASMGAKTKRDTLVYYSTLYPPIDLIFKTLRYFRTRLLQVKHRAELG